jgi:hypothetical protein
LLIGEKFSPEIVKIVPPFKLPVEGVTPVTLIWYLKLRPPSVEGTDLPNPYLTNDKE